MTMYPSTKLDGCRIRDILTAEFRITFPYLGTRGRRIINHAEEHVDKHPNVVLPAREVHTVRSDPGGASHLDGKKSLFVYDVR